MANYTKTKTGKEARHKLLKGARELYKLVSVTLGPRGRNVVINKGYDYVVLHDGVKVSRFVSPKIPIEKAGADILRDAAEKQVQNCGDGTTLVSVLGYQIAREAMTLIDSGVNAMSLKSGLEKGRDLLVEELNRLSTPITTKQQKIQVATVSAQDEQLGKMIGETYHKIGVDGVIVADDSKTNETYLDHQEGISLDRGYISPYFITDIRTMTASVKEAYILITDKELEDIYEFLDFVEKVLKPQKEKGLPTQNLVVIANDIRGTLLASMIATKQKGMMNILGIKAPAFGQYKKELMEDLAVMTGGKFVDSDSHVRLGELKFETLGYADVVKCTRETTTIMGNKGEIKDINARIEGIKTQLDDPESEYNEEKLRERLSKMTGGVYVIKTGGGSEKEVEEKRERIDDAILATKSAILHGIVPGGEVTFLKILEVLKTKDQNEEYAFRILKSALTKPFQKLLLNAGLDAGYFKAKLEDKPFGYGVNVVTGQIEDLVNNGIVDPTEVLTESIISAVSVAVLLLTSDGFSTIVEKENK